MTALHRADGERDEVVHESGVRRAAAHDLVHHLRGLSPQRAANPREGAREAGPPRRRQLGARAHVVSLAAAPAAAAAAAHGTLCHAFLLADNRHVSFYLWRHVLGKHPAVRYALVPLHVLLGWRLLPPIWARQRGQSAPLVGAPSSAPLGLLRARLAALGSSVLPE